MVKRDGPRAVYDHDNTWDYASRYAFFLTFERWPVQANHHCDNPLCCNTGPGHVYEGTQQQNIADRDARSRRKAPRGEASAKSKLTQTQVDEIRRRYTGKHGQQTDLAHESSVSVSTINKIVRGVNW